MTDACENPDCDEDKCPFCCLHEELDHGICSQCETDLNEHLAMTAYDRAKDLYKYGD